MDEKEICCKPKYKQQEICCKLKYKQQTVNNEGGSEVLGTDGIRNGYSNRLLAGGVKTGEEKW